MKVILWIVGIAIVIGMIFGGGDTEDSSAESAGDSSSENPAEEEAPDRSEVIGDEIGAQVVCEQFVEDQLKSPSTAEFSGEVVHRLRGKVWIVAGEVDSENSFGAMIRNDYTCKARFVGDDQWRLLRMEGLTN